MRVKKIDHVGIAVEDLEAIPAALRKLLSPAPPVVEDVPDQGVKTTSYHAGGTSVEFLESRHDGSPVGRYLAKRGNGIHHVALEVDDLEGALAELKAGGVELIDEVPKTGAGGKRIAFIHPRSAGGILIELCSKAPA